MLQHLARCSRDGATGSAASVLDEEEEPQPKTIVLVCGVECLVKSKVRSQDRAGGCITGGFLAAGAFRRQCPSARLRPWESAPHDVLQWTEAQTARLVAAAAH